MPKDKNAALVLFVAVFTVVWTAFEFLYAALITHSSYSFRLGSLAEPLLIGILIGYFLVYKRVGDINDRLEEMKNVSGAVLLDVRRSDEYNYGHIPGAVNLPLDRIDEIESVVPDKETPLFIYCLRGSRSSRAARILRSKGYTKAVSIGGVDRYTGEIAE
jgi:rhodanese-related sulfurtransferase